MEYKSLNVDVFKKTLGSDYEELKGNFNAKLFGELLDQYRFDLNKHGRELLRIALKKEGFFEVTKGNWIVCILL